MLEPDPTPGFAEYRLLVAEDEPHLQRILGMILEAQGFQVDIASDGHQALERLRSKAVYHLVLLDLVMPGASGLEILEWLSDSAFRPDLPVIVLTAKGQDTDRDQAFSLGARDFITKPFSPRKLLSRIHDLLPDHPIGS
ncbi:MAG: response regulator [Gemmatimonadota bacterium]